jgi:1-acyl-sn-glycerol-3-phosphate acyltransferase
LRAAGWRLTGQVPDVPKFIIAVAPHSSNYDFVLTILTIWSLGLRASYLAKASLFRFPLGYLMRHFGGIPVDRSQAHGLVDTMAMRFDSCDQLILGITPEGTRGTVRSWRLGFANIAQAANVPVLPAIINYQTHEVSFHALICDVNDPGRTLQIVQQAAMTGAPRYPQSAADA